jgi:predicted DCC family thiol-disulfide oxidoreductase YuxK
MSAGPIPQLTPQPTPQLTLYYDHACALCRIEMQRLARWDRGQWLAFIDSSAVDFDAAAHGFTAAALDRELHGVCADGRVLRGLACIRQAYALTRCGWLWRITALPGLKSGFDAFYLWFARHRRAISRYVFFGRAQEACTSACATKLTGPRS